MEKPFTNEERQMKDITNSPLRIKTSPMENRSRTSILYKNRIETEMLSQISVSYSSPTKILNQTSLSAGFKSTTSSQFEFKQNVPIRTQTYSPVASKMNSSAKKGSPKLANFDPGSFFYESPGKKRINLANSSVKVMKKVFDEDYSLQSPSKKRAYDDDLYESLKTQSDIGNNSQQISTPVREPELNFKILNDCYSLFIQKLKANPLLENARIEIYLNESLNYLGNADRRLRIGAMINIFNIIHLNKSSISPEKILHVCSQIVTLIPKYLNSDDFYSIYCSLEILVSIEPNNVLYDNINLLSSLICQEKFVKIKQKAFQVLINLEYPGLFALLDLANKDFNQLPLDVLNLLAQCPEIQARVIVPSLIDTLNSNDVKKKHSSLAALNRMFVMVKHGGGLPILTNLLMEGSLDRELIASTIMSCGPAGEQVLLKILRNTTDLKTKQAICAVFPWRIQSYNQSKIKIIIVPYQVSQHYHQNPGTMCIYSGNLKPLSHLEIAEEASENSEDVIEINSRDFLASLQRLLNLKYQEFTSKESKNLSPKLTLNSSINSQLSEEIKNFNNFGSLNLIEFIAKDKEEDEQANIAQPLVSSNVIKGLINAFNDKDPGVRESVVHAVGLIGPPEAGDALEILTKALYDSSSEVRAIGAWALGKLGDIASIKAAKRLIELLKDKFWKVRTSACIALGYMAENVDPLCYSTLVKILKDGSINKVVVCETLVRLGAKGEEILLDILKNTPNTNHNLKTAIIQSFELAEVDRQTIDFVIEEIFRNASDPMAQVRKACLITLDKLRLKSQNNNITYLKSRNILPLFYYFLQDAENDIKSMALQAIHSFGPQGELMLIEGLAKDKNPLIRAECAKGLGLFGPSTFRTLLFGLRDSEDNVRMATSATLLKSFSSESVMNAFSQKHHQKPGIIYSIQEILNLNYYYGMRIKQYLEEILEHFQNELNVSGSAAGTYRKDKSNLITLRENEERLQENENASPHLVEYIKTAYSTNFSIDESS